MSFLVTVADYISRAESQSRQRPPLERMKPSEDSLSGQKVDNQDTAYPTVCLGQVHRKLCVVESTGFGGVEVKLRVEQPGTDRQGSSCLCDGRSAYTLHTHELLSFCFPPAFSAG